MRTRTKKSLAVVGLLVVGVVLAGAWAYSQRSRPPQAPEPQRAAPVRPAKPVVLPPEQAELLAQAKKLREQFRAYEQGTNGVPANIKTNTKKGTP